LIEANKGQTGLSYSDALDPLHSIQKNAEAISAAATPIPPSLRSWQALTKPFSMTPLRVSMSLFPRDANVTDIFLQPVSLRVGETGLH